MLGLLRSHAESLFHFSLYQSQSLNISYCLFLLNFLSSSSIFYHKISIIFLLILSSMPSVHFMFYEPLQSFYCSLSLSLTLFVSIFLFLSLISFFSEPRVARSWSDNRCDQIKICLKLFYPSLSKVLSGSTRLLLIGIARPKARKIFVGLEQ